MKTDNSLMKEAPWHPDKPDWGNREEELLDGSKIYLASEDSSNIAEGDVIRLKNLCNVQVQDQNLVFSGFEHKKGIKIFQWSSAHKHIDLHYPDGSVSEGIVEDNISSLGNHVVQFERTGFVRLEGDKAFFLHR